MKLEKLLKQGKALTLVHWRDGYNANIQTRNAPYDISKRVEEPSKTIRSAIKKAIKKWE